MTEFTNQHLTNLIQTLTPGAKNLLTAPTTDASGTNGDYFYDGIGQFYFKANDKWLIMTDASAAF